ncbi:hypothetical protein [Clostridium sp. 'White wine YQ']|uniref:hypothetical protein n=1 Tax=Clostridium sp. 'White wine YQ' TaxID=3027474 RepID=UPI002366B37D|nr:hypothetical protein [Clostridium sp. 'White wine YQ']MDD7794276.1 hypothetical protein [Clostridium sp. 'White wine YQ']
MKRFIAFFIILSCISFNIMIPASATTLFKEGVYKLSDLNVPEGEFYSAVNLSKENEVLVQIYDEKQVLLQLLKMPPGAKKFNLVSLKPNYRIVILGNGQISIT